jgi:poly(hydroxyalkanoate) depolymerase family esterase
MFSCVPHHLANLYVSVQATTQTKEFIMSKVIEEKLYVDLLESSQPRSDLPRRRWPWITASILALVVVTVGIGSAFFQFGLPWWMQAGDRNHVFEGEIGSLRYQVHLPPQYDGITQLPVIMAIHGCGMTGYGYNSMKATTQFNTLADSEGFIVIYPTQRILRNLVNCWNSSDPREQHRYSGEPALLAGVAKQVLEAYNADPTRVHVTGASSGAGTAVILAATYPDVFATVASVAGGEYGLNQVDPSNPDSTPPDYTARQAWAQMGNRARQVPMLVIQGEEDAVVPPIVATRLVEHWTAVNDFVDDGLLNGSLNLFEETTKVSPEQGKHSYTHTTITTPNGKSFLEFYFVQDMGHVWPGPDGDGTYTDHAGPDASALIWDFAKNHSKL